VALGSLATAALYVLCAGRSGGMGAGGLALLLVPVAALLLVLPVPRRTLWLLLLPALVQFHSVSGRLSGDGASYYAQLRSLARDHDVDLADEYEALGLADRPDLSVPTVTGLRRTVFPVGPALMDLPFFALGEILSGVRSLAGAPVDRSGYGPFHVNAVALGGLLYGFLAVWLVEGTLRRHFAASTARLAALLMWAATFLHWYMVQQPVMSHTASAFLAAAFVWQWDRTRPATRPRDALWLGAIGGLALAVRWQNAVLLALPALDGLGALRRSGGARAAKTAALAAAVAALGLVPQMLVWRALYGQWLLAAPPQGTDFVRLGRPFLLETLFSSRHGLLSWTPVLWAGFLGFVPLLRRRPAVAGPLLLPLLALTYVNACSGDWWAGGSFSNRRFDSLLPVLAFGIAAAIDTARRALRRHPSAAPAALVALLAAWNLPLTYARARGTLPADDTVSFDALAGGIAGTVADEVGSPNTWPASWLFAWRHGLPPARYDTLVGRYLYYRQNNQRGCVEPGEPAFATQLWGEWGAREEPNGPARVLRGAGSVLVGLDLPEDFLLRLSAGALETARVQLAVNGRDAGSVTVGPDWRTRILPVPAAFWRRDLNAVTLRPDRPVWVRTLRFDHGRGEPPLPCGI
jgi:hypothetical protein